MSRTVCIAGPGGGWYPELIVRFDPNAALEDVHHETAPLFYLMPLVLPGMYKRKRFIFGSTWSTLEATCMLHHYLDPDGWKAEHAARGGET